MKINLEGTLSLDAIETSQLLFLCFKLPYERQNHNVII